MRGLTKRNGLTEFGAVRCSPAQRDMVLRNAGCDRVWDAAERDGLAECGSAERDELTECGIVGRDRLMECGIAKHYGLTECEIAERDGLWDAR